MTFVARVLPPGEATLRLAKVLSKSGGRGEHGQPYLLFPDSDILVWTFPHDPKLTGLSRLLDDRKLRNAWVPSVLENTDYRAMTLIDVSVEVVRYNMMRCCTLRVRATLRDPTTQRYVNPVFYVKTYNDDAGEQTYANMVRLANESLQAKSLFVVPIVYQQETKSLWTHAVTGPTLAMLPRKSDALAQGLSRAGECIAHLHTFRLPYVNVLSTATIVDKLLTVESQLSQYVDVTTTNISPICAVLVREPSYWNARAQVTTHHDLHLNNFIVTRSGVVVIDLDNLSCADPGYDPGRFLAGLYLQSSTQSEQEDRSVEQMFAEFLRAYRLNVDWDLPDCVINWFALACLITVYAPRYAARRDFASFKLTLGLIQRLGVRHFGVRS